MFTRDSRSIPHDTVPATRAVVHIDDLQVLYSVRERLSLEGYCALLPVPPAGALSNLASATVTRAIVT